MKSILLTLFVIMGVFSSTAQTELTDDNAIDSLNINNDRLRVLYFYDTSSEDCIEMHQIIKGSEEVFKEHVDFFKIDVNKNEIDSDLYISTVPTCLFIKNSELLKQVEGRVHQFSMFDLILEHYK